MSDSRAPLRVGDLLGACESTIYCGGHFGRDAYGPFTVEAVGADWVVARDADGDAWFAGGAQFNPEHLTEYRFER